MCVVWGGRLGICDGEFHGADGWMPSPPPSEQCVRFVCRVAWALYAEGDVLTSGSVYSHEDFDELLTDIGTAQHFQFLIEMARDGVLTRVNYTFGPPP